MRRLSTAARICAPMRVRSKPSHSPITIDDADHDQEDAVGAVVHDAEIELAAAATTAASSGWFSGPTDQRHRRDHHEDQADGEQHLVELAGL